MLRKLFLLISIVVFLYRFLNKQSAKPATPPKPNRDPSEHYRTLEVDASASIEDIKESHRRLSRLHHPDTVASQPLEVQRKASERMASINLAYAEIKKQRKFI